MKVILVRDFKINENTSEITIIGCRNDIWSGKITDTELIQQYKNGNPDEVEEAKILMIKEILENYNLEYDLLSFLK